MLTEIPDLLDEQSLKNLFELIEQASWVSGKYSAGDHAVDIKHNDEMNQQCDSWKAINQLVVNTLYQHPGFQSAALPSKVSAAFVSRYTTGMKYASHIDDPVMGNRSSLYRSDIAVTVFLSDPDTYDGGELNIHTRFGPVPVKLSAGSAVVYPASSLHEVTEVTRGERLACVLWAQSLVRDTERREILSDLDDARQALHLSASQAQVTKSIDRTYANLLRMWSDV